MNAKEFIRQRIQNDWNGKIYLGFYEDEEIDIFELMEGYHKSKAENLPISDVRLSFSNEKFRELFNELINAGRDMQTRDNLGNSYMSEDMYFKDVKARYSNEA